MINNAGAYFSQYSETEEQLEMTFALNHLSYFQLTMLLIDAIEFEIPGRVINVASSAHFGAQLNLNDIQMKKKYAERLGIIFHQIISFLLVLI